MSDFNASVALPTELIQEFVQLLSDKKNFDKWKAITLGLKVAQWLVETFAGYQAGYQVACQVRGVCDG